MKTIIFVIISLFVFISNSYALKCDKCHRDDKVISKIVQEREIKSKDELINKLRNGKMSKIHRNLTDDDINKASDYLQLK